MAIVNESFARRFWPAYPRGLPPVGQHVLIGDNQANALEIVGIVPDVHESGLATATGPEIYLPSHLYPLQTAALIVHATADPVRLTNAIKGQILAVDPDQPVSSVKSMEELLASSIGKERVSLLLLGLFAGLALLLAVIGIYGVLAYSVLQRAQELGVRIALGAQSRDILRLVIGQGVALAISGVLIGTVAALALTRAMRSLLFEVSPTDPLAFILIAFLLLAAALAASALPAWRATRVDPMQALR